MSSGKILKPGRNTRAILPTKNVGSNSALVPYSDDGTVDASNDLDTAYAAFVWEDTILKSDFDATDPFSVRESPIPLNC